MDRADRLEPEQLLAHVEWMRRLARALVRDAEEADDLAQSGLEAALTSPPLTDRSVRPWLAGVLRNLARMRLRGGARRLQRETLTGLERTDPPSPETMALEVETQRRVAAHVLALGEPLRTTLLLRYYEGKTSAEIARLQGLPPGTVRWRLKQGLDQVRALLDGEDRGPGRNWRLVLTPMALRTGRDPGQAAPFTLATGAALMTMKTKLALTTALLVLLLGSGLWLSRGSDQRDHSSRTRIVAAPGVLRLAVRPEGLQMATTSPAEPAGSRRLVGQVIDAAEQPIEGAAVAIDSSPPRLATTDVNGGFAFDGLRARTYRLEAQAGDLYAGPVRTPPSPSGEPVVLRARPAAQLHVEVRAARDSAAVPDARVELRSTLVWRAETDARGEARLTGVGPGWYPLRVEAPGFAASAQMVVTSGDQAPQRIVVRLVAGRSVSGRVLGPDGAPVGQAQVWPRASSEPFRVVDPAFDAVATDQAGRFRIDALAPGSYQIAAAHPELAPGVTAPLVVADQAVEGVELRLHAGGRLSGEVRDQQGRPVAGAEVRAGALSRSLPWSDTRDAFTDEAGRFHIGGLPRRSVQVMALGLEGASPMVSADLAGAAEAVVTLQLSLHKSIAGLVVDGQGRPVPEAQVTAAPAGPGPAGAQSSTWDLRGFPTMVSDGAGAFRLTGLPDGEYQVRASRPGTPPGSGSNQPATRARPGDEGLRVLARGEGTVVGRALFEDGSAPASFSLMLGRMKAGAFAGTDGSFTVSSPAGEHALSISGPSFLTTRIDRVEVREQEHRDLGVVRLLRGRSITGRVLDAQGAPVAEAQVAAGRQLTGSGSKLYIPGESREGRETSSDQEGKFVLTGFDRGPLVVMAEREGQGRSAATPIGPGSGPATVDLVLRPLGSLEGRISRDGAPFADTVVTATPELGLASFFVTSGPDGRYALDTLAAGDYFLTAFLGRNKDMWMAPATVVAGKRNQANLEVTTGSITLTVKVEADDRSPVAMANVLVISGAVPVRDGDTLMSVRDRLRPTAPTTVYFRSGPGSAAIEGLRPGLYTLCAVAARSDPAAPKAAEPARVDMTDPLRCATRPLSATTSVTVTVPKSSTVPKG